MTPDESEESLSSFIAARGKSAGQLTPEEALDLLIAFYEQVPAVGCEPESGDMLLFQCGFAGFVAGHSSRGRASAGACLAGRANQTLKRAVLIPST